MPPRSMCVDGGRCPPYTTELAMIPRTDYSDACPPATQRRYHMQHASPLIFWLLLAATLSIDAVVSTLINPRLPQSSVQYSIIALHALVFGQLSIVCIWLMQSAPSDFRWMSYDPAVGRCDRHGHFSAGNCRGFAARHHGHFHFATRVLWFERRDFARGCLADTADEVLSLSHGRPQSLAVFH